MSRMASLSLHTMSSSPSSTSPPSPSSSASSSDSFSSSRLSVISSNSSSSSSPPPIPSIDEQIAAINRKIEKIEKEIESAAEKVAKYEANGDKEALQRWSKKEERLGEEKLQLGREKERLGEEKLRWSKKEEQLREEKKLQLQLQLTEKELQLGREKERSQANLPAGRRSVTIKELLQLLVANDPSLKFKLDQLKHLPKRISIETISLVECNGSIDRSLKFVGRKDAIDEMVDHVNTCYENYARNSAHPLLLGAGIAGEKRGVVVTDDHYDAFRRPKWFVSCSGAPGIGKTTFARRIFEKVKDNERTYPAVKTLIGNCIDNNRRIRIDFARNPNLSDEDTDPLRSLALRILYELIKSSLNMSYQEFYFNVRLYTIRLDDVIQYGHDLSTDDQESGPRMWVIHFDETNVVLDQPTGRKYLSQIMSALLQLLFDAKALIQVVLTGTDTLNLAQVITNSGGYFRSISLPLLSLENMKKVIDDFYYKCQLAVRPSSSNSSSSPSPTMLATAPVRLHPYFDYILKLLNGIPRYLEFFLLKCGNCNCKDNTTLTGFCVKCAHKFLSISDHKYTELWRVFINAVKLIGDRYGMKEIYGIGQDMAVVLLGYTLFNWPCSRDRPVMRNSTTTWQQLEQRGAVFLQRSTTSAAEFVPKSSFVFLHFLYENNRKQWNNLPLLHLMELNPTMTWSQNEQMDLSILMLKMQAYQLSRVDVDSFGIPTSSLFPTRKGMKFDTIRPPPSFVVAKSADDNGGLQVSKETWPEVLKVAKNKDTMYGGWMNANAAPFADAFVVSSPPILLQSKSLLTERLAAYSNPKKRKFELTSDTIKKEHAKCDVPDDHLFVFLTDECIDSDQLSNLKPNEIVITPDNASEYYGDLLALRKQMSFDDSVIPAGYSPAESKTIRDNSPARKVSISSAVSPLLLPATASSQLQHGKGTKAATSSQSKHAGAFSTSSASQHSRRSTK